MNNTLNLHFKEQLKIQMLSDAVTLEKTKNYIE